MQPPVDAFSSALGGCQPDFLLYWTHLKEGNYMMLAEKIMMLRKQKGWSQEDLAVKLNVSRQSVSKWESTASIPDLGKIIKLSEIFGVSTDFLLKDEVELEEGVEESPAVIPTAGQANDFKGAAFTEADSREVEEEYIRSVSLEEADDFMDMTARTATWIALGVALCIMSPILLIVIGGLADYGVITVSENVAGGIGTIILLVMIGIAVAIFILKGMKLDKYQYLEKECFSLECGIYEIVEKKKQDFEGTFRVCIAIGVVLCIFGVIPVLVAVLFPNTDIIAICGTGMLLFMVACGVYLFVWSGMIQGSYEKLLQSGEYTVNNKRFHKKNETISSIYWCIITAIYLGVSFWTMGWHFTWIIWPCAGVLYGAFCGIMKMIFGRK